jgi:hypothetical protein
MSDYQPLFKLRKPRVRFKISGDKLINQEGNMKHDRHSPSISVSRVDEE